MKPELYKDQFTPWVPNHLIDESVIPLDLLGGAIVGHMRLRDQEGLVTTCNLLYCTVATNYYLSIFTKNSITSEEE